MQAVLLPDRIRCARLDALLRAQEAAFAAADTGIRDPEAFFLHRLACKGKICPADRLFSQIEKLELTALYAERLEDVPALPG